MIGDLAIYISLITAWIAAVLFFLPALNKQAVNTNQLKNASYVFYVHAAAVVAASIYLFYAILTHRFEYAYVYEYSDLSLPLKYLISAFWAGQEGTFLLWALFGVLAVFLVLKREKGQELGAAVLSLLMAGQVFLFIFMVIESPFALMEGGVPGDGAGLNPLLMDPWMVIHPPVTFLGYALFLVPSAYAIAALWKKDYHNGFLRALPWAVVAWFFLGAGIFLGAAWAYRVLGWGGYWGWDPVENASLIPWLSGAALVHAMIIQRQKRFMTRSSILLAIVTFVLVVFATFLTRSGVMADFSVHAFAATQLTYWLVAFMAFFGLLGLGLFISRYQEIPPSEPVNVFSRGGIFSLTVIVLSAATALVFFGTTSPIITGWFGTSSTADQTFYIRTLAPLSLVLFLLLAVGPFLSWKGEDPLAFLRKLALPFAAAVIAVIIGIFFGGMRSIFDLVFLGSIVLALGTNARALPGVFRRGIKHSGAYLAHVGLAMMFVGMLGSMAYVQSEVLALGPGKSAQAFGYNFSYTGISEEDNKSVVNIEVVDAETEQVAFTAKPSMWVARDQLMKQPYIARNLVRDIYITSDVKPAERESFKLAKGESYSSGDYSFTFRDFDYDSTAHEEEGAALQIGAFVEVSQGDTTETLVPKMEQDSQGNWQAVTAPLSEDAELILEAVDATNGQVQLAIDDANAQAEEQVTVEVKKEPLIAVLAIGTVLLMIGTLIAVWRRFAR